MNAAKKTSGAVALEWLRRAILITGLTIAACLMAPALFPGTTESHSDSAVPLQTTLASPDLSTSTTPVTTRPIDSIRVGDRVLARNPEVGEEERSQWEEPNWNQCFHLTLEMPLPGSNVDEPKLLHIELLRPESWLREQLGYVVDQEPELSTLPTTLSDKSTNPAAPPLIPLAPLRAVYRDIVLTTAVAESEGLEVIGLTVEMDLPEMGAYGTAIITGIQASPAIKPGVGQVVTATFSHPPANQVLNVTFEGEANPLGVTDNHLFWSVEQDKFLPIGEMAIGEHVTTYAGETKRIESKLPRPGPQTVYNLEVYGEHVYFVGQLGVLAHNNYVSEGLPETLAQQRQLSSLSAEARTELVSDFALLRNSLSMNQLDSIIEEPWRMQLFFGTVLEARVANRVRSLVADEPGHLLASLQWTGRTNAPQDFIGRNGFGFDITGNSLSSIRSHAARAQVQAVVTYESIPSNLGYRFVRWLDQ
ncbi:hypothetical protein [Blastopirellula retiformator]|uniref:Uncharacterized protein n=1 Tax=Blastopirellula retiformator TaxID=2527970 RepID=A0A5C5V8L7_9BACT|nr:hypothetical protein [Blastopirellula retiformator]TWT34908.1 hypothetical protein Enr8_23230 [Blastopirellula retiformator]